MSKRGWKVFSKVSEMSEDVFLIRSFDKKEVGGIKFKSDFKFYLNICPHASAPVCKGNVRDLIYANVNKRLAIDEETKVLHCPWHGMEFRIDDGKAIAQSSLKLGGIRHKRIADEIHIYI